MAHAVGEEAERRQVPERREAAQSWDVAAEAAPLPATPSPVIPKQGGT